MGVDAELTQRVAATANRLRLLQADFADEPGDIRAGVLRDELDQALRPLVADHRQAFLSELKRYFPVWDDVLQSAVAGTAGQTDELAAADPATLTTRLCALAAHLNDEQKQTITARLSQAGLAPAATSFAGGGDVTVSDDLRQRLGLTGDQHTDSARVVELLAMMLDMLAKLDQLAWKTWLAIAPSTPRSTVPRPGELTAAAGKYVAGDPETPRSELARQIERLRQLTAAMISAAPAIGHRFGTRFEQQLSPQAIQASTQAGGFANKQAAYWKKYVEQAGELDAAAIEHQIRQLTEEFVRSLMQGGK